MTAEAIAKAPGGSRTGGTWMASWPAHDDREPSLSIRSADEKSASWPERQGWPVSEAVEASPKTTPWRFEDIRALIEPGALGDG
jgi:hypothetical protein